MPGLKIRLSLSSRFFSSSSTPTTPSTEDFPPTPRSNSFRHKARPSLSKFFGVSTPSSPTSLDLTKLQLDDGKYRVQEQLSRPSHPTRRQTAAPQKATRPTHRRTITAVLQRHENRCLQALSERVFVAFEDDFIPFGGTPSEDLRAPSGAPFDHFVRVTSHPRPGLAQGLDIFLPPREHPHYLEDMEMLSTDPDIIVDNNECRVSSLDIDQLVMVRDFIFTSVGTVLITTPRDARAEAMTIGLACLAYSTGYGARQLTRNFNAREVGFMSVWQNVLSENGLEICRRVAARRAVYYEDSDGVGYH